MSDAFVLIQEEEHTSSGIILTRVAKTLEASNRMSVELSVIRPKTGITMNRMYGRTLISSLLTMSFWCGGK